MKRVFCAYPGCLRTAPCKKHSPPPSRQKLKKPFVGRGKPVFPGHCHYVDERGTCPQYAGGEVLCFAHAKVEAGLLNIKEWRRLVTT